MNFHNNIHIGSTRLTGCGNSFYGAGQIMLTVAATDLSPLGGENFGKGFFYGWGKDRINFNGVITLGHGVLNDVIIILRIIQQG
ncbi:hypothetical protein SDC9_165638 [bioreactor metagenome]|uniref:Uncharacterized protein n=1 Tax=bioreactor metagenome TaxID=1076179 RepID=A0A645FUU1_9ZZZZ